MNKKVLGRTGLKVTQLGFGAMELRGPKVWSGREISEGQSEAILNAVLDAGINFVDTAVDYGLSEERIGKYISSRRDEYYLATKCGCKPRDMGERWETPHEFTRENLLSNIEGSLKRMKTDYVDILQLHNPTPEQVRDGRIVEVLKEIQGQGLTRFISISTTQPHLEEFVEMGAFDTFQIPYSCLEPQHEDAISLAAESGAGIIIRGGVNRGGPEGAMRQWANVDLWEKAKLEEVLGGMTAPELILRYTLTHAHCDTAIVGTMNVDHLAGNIAAVKKGPLPAEVYDEVHRRVGRVLEQEGQEK